MPEEALAGLTEEERSHIFKVMAESRQRTNLIQRINVEEQIPSQVNPLETEISLPMGEFNEKQVEKLDEEEVMKDDELIVEELFGDELDKENEELEVKDLNEELNEEKEEVIEVEDYLDKLRKVEEEEELLKKIIKKESKETLKTSKFGFGGFLSFSQRLANKVSDTFTVSNIVDEELINKDKQIEDQSLREILLIEKSEETPKQELTEEELEHIRKVTELAALSLENNFEELKQGNNQRSSINKEIIILKENKKEFLVEENKEINELEEILQDKKIIKEKESSSSNSSPFCPEFWLQNNQTKSEKEIFEMANNNNVDSRSSSGIGDSEGEQSGIECVGESNILR